MFYKNTYFTLSVTHQTFESFVCAKHWGLKSVKTWAWLFVSSLEKEMDWYVCTWGTLRQCSLVGT